MSVEQMVRLAKGLEALHIGADQVAEALLAHRVEWWNGDSNPAVRKTNLRVAEEVARLGIKAKNVEVLLVGVNFAYLPSTVLESLLKYFGAKASAYQLLADLRRGWLQHHPISEGSMLHKLLLMYAALVQEAQDANQAPPVIEAQFSAAEQADLVERLEAKGRYVASVTARGAWTQWTDNGEPKAEFLPWATAVQFVAR